MGFSTAGYCAQTDQVEVRTDKFADREIQIRQMARRNQGASGSGYRRFVRIGMRLLLPKTFGWHIAFAYSVDQSAEFIAFQLASVRFPAFGGRAPRSSAMVGFGGGLRDNRVRYSDVAATAGCVRSLAGPLSRPAEAKSRWVDPVSVLTAMQPWVSTASKIRADCSPVPGGRQAG